jgi:hypothetical protein
VIRGDSSLVLIDPDTGATRGSSTPLSNGPNGVASPQLFDLGSGRIAVLAGGALSVIDREGEALGTPRRVPLTIDQPTQVGRRFYVAAADGRIVAYATRDPAPSR